MRIAIDAHMLGDKSGGNESYYSDILKELHPAPGDEVFLFARPEADVKDYENTFHIVRFSTNAPFKRNFVELNQLCKKYQIDVLHCQYFIPFFCPCKIVCTIFDICFEHYKDIFSKKEYIRQKLLIPYAAKHSDYIMTDSFHAANDISEHYGIDKNRIVVAYGAVSDDFRELSSEELNEIELRSRFGIGDSKYILTVGNLQPRKNLPRLIDAFIEWSMESQSNSKLVIVGKKAWLFSDILDAARNSDNIIFTDYVSESDLIRLYNAATCFIYPSFFEGFGIPPLEAMACGTPVAVANATSLPEVVGDAGLYFDPFSVEDIRNAICCMMTDTSRRNALTEKGIMQKQKFDWGRSADVMYGIYNRLK